MATKRTISTDSVRFVAVGAGFWAGYQLAAWQDVPGATCVALCDRNRTRAEALAQKLGIPRVYEDAEEMLVKERPAFLDVITTEEFHSPLVHLAVRQKVPVICQKPMAPTFELCQSMVSAAKAAGVRFAVHENFRFQTPMLAVKSALDSGGIGQPYRARIQAISAFNPFLNQPNLKDLERFIITDGGSHILDLARFFFGEADRIFCVIHRINPEIKGEDAATIMLRMKNGASVTCHLGMAGTPIENDAFPETTLFIEGQAGSIEMAPGCVLRVTTKEGTASRKCLPPRLPWAHPEYLVGQTSMVACNQDLLEGMVGKKLAATNGEDNLKTMELVFKAYESARTGEALAVGGEAK